LLVVLPKKLKDRLVAELNKRLDLDLDELLSSPKLRLKLSPAELDKSLLELYDTLSESPGGDILRVIGGGGSIGLQNYYMRRRAERERWQKLRDGIAPDIFPVFQDEEGAEDKDKSASQLVRRLLMKNIPKEIGDGNRIYFNSKSSSKEEENRNTPSMCYASRKTQTAGLSTWTGLRPSHSLHHMPARRGCTKFSILI